MMRMTRLMIDLIYVSVLKILRMNLHSTENESATLSEIAQNI